MSGRGFASFWRRLLLRRTAFSGAYGQLRLLYAIEDPWNLESEREAHRFSQTNVMLGEICRRFDNILELGCGEGRQSVMLSELTKTLYGVDVSGRAVARARQRLPGAALAVAKVEDIDSLFPGVQFDLVCACEVLYYLPDPEKVIQRLQIRANRILVTNYGPRADRMRAALSQPGWRRLSDIVFEDVHWECHLWTRGLGPG